MATVNVMGFPPDLPELTGPVLLGYFFTWGLFGVLTIQCYLYYLAFPRDPYYFKGVVGFIYLVEGVQTILSTHEAFRQYALGWGNFDTLNHVGMLWLTIPTLDGIISGFVQLFYAWRVYVLSGSNGYVAGVISFLAVLQGSFGIYCGVCSKIIANFSEIQGRMYKPTIVWLGGSALCDVTITINMLYFLRRARSRSGTRYTTVLITRLIKLTFETGLICSAFAIIDLALFLCFRGNNFHLLPAMTLGKLYSNSLLVVFNSRINMTGGRNVPEPENFLSTIGLSTGVYHSTSNKMGTPSGRLPPPIKYEVDQLQDVDIQLRAMADYSTSYGEGDYRPNPDGSFEGVKGKPGDP